MENRKRELKIAKKKIPLLTSNIFSEKETIQQQSIKEANKTSLLFHATINAYSNEARKKPSAKAPVFSQRLRYSLWAFRPLRKELYHPTRRKFC